jgi:hypothetical protein
MEVHSTTVTALGGDAWRVRLAVHNTGYLPSYVTKRALERKVVRGVVFEVDLPEDAALLAGKARAEGPQLEGRSGKSSLQAFLPTAEITGDRAQCEWTIRGRAGARVGLVARHERAGRVSIEVTLA